MISSKGEEVNFGVVKRDIKMFKFEILRTDGEDFFEGVIIQQEINKLTLQLKSLLGEAVYPSKNKLEQKVSRIVDEFGGLIPGQSLYYKDLGTQGVFVMLWPWKDGQHTTVKIIQR